MQHLRLVHTTAEAHRPRVQAGQRRGRVDLRFARQAADQRRAEGVGRAADAAQHLVAELEGAGRGHNDSRCRVAGLAAVIIEHVIGDRRVRVDQVAMVAPGMADLLARLDIIAEAASEHLLDLCLERIGDRRSRLLDTRMSIDGDAVVWNGRFLL